MRRPDQAPGRAFIAEGVDRTAIVLRCVLEPQHPRHRNSKASAAAIDLELASLVCHLGVRRKTLTPPEFLDTQ
jgi:hypothetical protein